MSKIALDRCRCMRAPSQLQVRLDRPISPGDSQSTMRRRQHASAVGGKRRSTGGEYLLTLEEADCALGKRLTGAKVSIARTEVVFAKSSRQQVLYS